MAINKIKKIAELILLKDKEYSEIEKLKEKNETMQDFIKRLIEKFIFQQDIELVQLEKMKELWDNEEDDIWNKAV